MLTTCTLRLSRSHYPIRKQLIDLQIAMSRTQRIAMIMLLLLMGHAIAMEGRQEKTKWTSGWKDRGSGWRDHGHGWEDRGNGWQHRGNEWQESGWSDSSHTDTLRS